MALLDLADVKAQLNISTANTSQDSTITVYMNAATAVVERHTGEVTSSAPFTEQIIFPGTAYVPKHPVTAVTAVTDTDGNTLDLSAFTFDDLSITSNATYGTVNVTYTAGYTTAPANYELAAMIIVQHLFESKRGGMPTASPSLDGGGAGIQPRTAFGFTIPKLALELLGAESPLGFG